MSRYHINPKTGNPGVCRAMISCPYGDLEKDHYESKEAARSAYEMKQERTAIEELIELKCQEHEELKKVADAQWTSTPSRFGMKNRQLTGDRQLWQECLEESDKKLAEIDILKNKLKTPVEPHYPDFPMGIGLENAQQELMEAINKEPESLGFSGHYYVAEIEPHMRETVARYLRGERSGDEDRINGYSLPSQRLLADLSGESGSTTMGQNLPYSVLIFPEKDLSPVLQRLGVENIAVSYFLNGRENGLVYTVMQPDGHARSFSFYEHRNTDSMIINCETDWNPQEEPAGPRPRESASKWDFIAEISGNERKRQAETLGYFLKEAQEGRLENDSELMMKAERLDWTAILSKQVPGFGQWAKDQGWDPDQKRDFEV